LAWAKSVGAAKNIRYDSSIVLRWMKCEGGRPDKSLWRAFLLCALLSVRFSHKEFSYNGTRDWYSEVV
jgi:hypothetical protein